MPIGPTQRETPTLLCHAPSEVDTTAADRFGSHEAMEATDMTTIKATCPVCGDVDLTPIDVRLTVAESAGWATYTFRCTECHDQARDSLAERDDVAGDFEPAPGT